MFQDSRWLSSAEAIFELFEMSMHTEYPNVVKLDVHLPQQQLIYFKGSDGLLQQVIFNMKQSIF